MNGNKRTRSRDVLLAMGGSLLCLLVLMVLFDPLPLLSDMISVTRVRWELPRAMDRWEAQEISSYKVNIKGAIPLLCFIDGEITVQNGQLVDVFMRENPLIPESSLLPIDPDRWDQSGCSFRDLTVESMFARVESSLETAKFGEPLTVKFDGEYGYITEYRFGHSSHGGILSPSVSECCTWFEFSNLTAKYP